MQVMTFVCCLIVTAWVVLVREAREERRPWWYGNPPIPRAQAGEPVHLVPLPGTIAVCSACHLPTVEILHEAEARGETLPSSPRAVCTCL